METRLTFSATTAAGRKKHRHLHAAVAKHSVCLAGNKTSITLENPFWEALQAIARDEDISVSTLIERIDTDRIGANLSSSVRLFVLAHYRSNRHPSEVSLNASVPSQTE